jgi:hypothetical protein
MALLLTTPLTVGGIDASDYTHVRIASFMLDSVENRIYLSIRFGYKNGSAWVSGVNIPNITVKDFEISGADYVAMVANTVGSDASKKIYRQASDKLYQWLIDNNHFIGTVE